MIPDRPDRVPDAIEPLTGYRAWYFDARGALFPISGDRFSATSPWEGADRGWVSATCRLQPPFSESDPVSRRLASIYAKIAADRGFPLGPYPAPHSVPDERCTCGFYAMKKLEAVIPPTGRDVIYGRVELAGKVIECTDGFRAERARIAELIPMPAPGGAAKRLFRRLGLPLAS